MAQGGGVYLDVATPLISKSTLANNRAIGGAGGTGGDGGTTGDNSLFGGMGGGGGTGQGGGLFVITSDFTFTLRATTVAGNIAQGGAGGRGGDGGANTLNNNSLTGGDGGDGGEGLGAGLYASSGTFTIRGSTFSTNQALGGDGGRGGDGGLGHDADSGNASMKGGDGGDAGNGRGGAVYLTFPGTVTLINSTVSSNTARGGDGGDGGNPGFAVDTSMGMVTDITSGDSGDGGNGGQGQGGGLYNSGGTLNLYNSTVALNQAQAGAGGLGDTNGEDGAGIGGGAFGDGVEFAFSTIFGDNVATTTDNDYSGDIQASACLFEDITGTTIIPGARPNITGLDPLLNPLAPNGGLTFTHGLQALSPAINAGVNPLRLRKDQRGFPRANGGRVDIGAFER
jgi:hypothetical protein